MWVTHRLICNLHTKCDLINLSHPPTIYMGNWQECKTIYVFKWKLHSYKIEVKLYAINWKSSMVGPVM